MCVSCNMLFYSMDSQLAQLEIKHHISRWTETDPEYISAKADDSRSSQSLIHKSLRATIVKRQFLLKLKAMYAGVLLAYLVVLTFLGCFFSLRWPKDC